MLTRDPPPLLLEIWRAGLYQLFMPVHWFRNRPLEKTNATERLVTEKLQALEGDWRIRCLGIPGTKRLKQLTAEKLPSCDN